MRTEVTVVQVNHYEMQDNKGLSVRIIGDFENTNNKFGLSVSEATVPNFNELRNLKAHAMDLPAKFSADLSFITKKDKGNKEITSIALSNLEFKHSLELVEKKVAVTK